MAVSCGEHKTVNIIVITIIMVVIITSSVGHEGSCEQAQHHQHVRVACHRLTNQPAS
jgi:hypothetical protein